MSQRECCSLAAARREQPVELEASVACQLDQWRHEDTKFWSLPDHSWSVWCNFQVVARTRTVHRYFSRAHCNTEDLVFFIPNWNISGADFIWRRRNTKVILKCLVLWETIFWSLWTKPTVWLADPSSNVWSSFTNWPPVILSLITEALGQKSGTKIKVVFQDSVAPHHKTDYQAWMPHMLRLWSKYCSSRS